MSTHNNPDVTTDPTETGVKHGAYPGMYLTRSGLTGVLRRMRKRGHTVDEPILRDAARQVVGGPSSGKVFAVRVCLGCGDRYTPTSAPQKFCTVECRRQEAKRDGRRAA